MTDGPDTVSARLYDGVRSEAHPVSIALTAGGPRLDGEERPLALRRLTEPVGSTAWLFELTDGRLIEAEPPAGATLARAFGHRRTAIMAWERSLVLALSAIPALALVVWLAAQYGVPLLADLAVRVMPPSVEDLAGIQTRIAFDRLSGPSTVPADRQARLAARFADMAGEVLGRRDRARLTFRDAPPIGPNAFTLPGGTVVVTDQLARILTDDEVMAVLAHELGHVQRHHVMRLVFRASGLTVLAGAVIGDAGSIGAALAGAPALVLRQGFSRDFESQADDVALAWLSVPGRGRSPCAFSDALRKITATLPASSGATLPTWLADHPGTPERMQRFDAACHRTGAPTQPRL